MACYLEHTAFPVRDINWHIIFFRDVLEMPVRQIAGDPDHPEQVWLCGGIQLKSVPDFNVSEESFVHLGIMTDDLEATLKRVHEYGAAELPRDKNWVRLPDGLEIEFIQAKNGAVEKILRISPR